jgi:8-oxo-dGTP diphosphatase
MSVLLLRHAWAGDREHWDGDDLLRPLDERGRRQALALRGLDVDWIVSSQYVRCIETVVPLAATRTLDIEVDRRLAEGAGRSALELLAELDGGVACTHGDVIHDLLGRSLDKGAAAIVEVADGGLRVLEVLEAP